MPRIDYDRLLASVPIDEVAKRLGMELRVETSTKAKALCPFHDDKTPSLLIDSSRDQGRQHFHCFACGAHGDAIDLVKERLNVGFREAVEWLSSGFAIVSMGTALGDFLADDSGLGFLGGAALIGGSIGAVALAYRFTTVNRVLLFWLAFVLTRPFGATFGDLLTKPLAKGGLNLGTEGSSLVLALILVALVLYSVSLPQQAKAVRDHGR